MELLILFVYYDANLLVTKRNVKAWNTDFQCASTRLLDLALSQGISLDLFTIHAVSNAKGVQYDRPDNEFLREQRFCRAPKMHVKRVGSKDLTRTEGFINA